MSDPDQPLSLKLSLFLRHNPGTKGSEPPPELWFATTSSEVTERLLGECEGVLLACAEQCPVLHGSVTWLATIAEALSEVTGTGTDVEKQSELFQRRHMHDRGHLPHAARKVVRRLYWMTLLGPTLATAAGSAAAARAAGALDVREIKGSLLFRAMKGPPRDSLDPEFLAATVGLRRWLWPHSFQNPLDAAGFEADVGLPVPATS